MRATPAGDAALLVEAEGLASGLAAAVVAQRWPDVLDAIPGACTVLVRTRPGSWDLGELASRILALPLRSVESAGLPLAEVPVCYDGPDLATVARLAGLSVAEVIATHAAAEYTVGWLGFSPGFGYLTGLDPALCGVPRLAQPRLRVPAGSVAIAGDLAAVYPSDSPGGWRLIGRTSAVLWDPGRDPPALLAPGMRVRFRATERLPAPASHVPDHAAHQGAPTRRLAASPPAAAPDHTAPPAPRSWIEVLRPGALATIQDLGRPGFGHLGVRQCGAADADSLRQANRLVGNPDGAACIEVTLGRAVFRCAAPCRLAVTGAPTAVNVSRGEGQPKGETGFGTAFSVPAGGVVQLGAPAAGLRTYVAVRGGVDVPEVLGSRSADLVAGLGPPPLRAGDTLPVGEAPSTGPARPPAKTPPSATARPSGETPTTAEWIRGSALNLSTEPRIHSEAGGSVSADEPPGAVGDLYGGVTPVGSVTAVTRGPARLGVIPGPRDDWFTAGAVEVLCGADYTVTQDSDRTGLRLDGPVLPRAVARELPSEGMVIGALQIPPDGRPILLLADYPVTGGYPVIAVVRSADIGRAAQLRPGQQVRFTISC